MPIQHMPRHLIHLHRLHPPEPHQRRIDYLVLLRWMDLGIARMPHQRAWVDVRMPNDALLPARCLTHGLAPLHPAHTPISPPHGAPTYTTAGASRHTSHTYPGNPPPPDAFVPSCSTTCCSRQT